MDMKKIKDRAVEGGHYSKWLHVPTLIEEIESMKIHEESLVSLIRIACGVGLFLFFAVVTLVGRSQPHTSHELPTPALRSATAYFVPTLKTHPNTVMDH